MPVQEFHPTVKFSPPVSFTFQNDDPIFQNNYFSKFSNGTMRLYYAITANINRTTCDSADGDDGDPQLKTKFIALFTPPPQPPFQSIELQLKIQLQIIK